MFVEPTFSVWLLTFDRRHVQPGQSIQTRSDYGAFLLMKVDNDKL